MKPRLFCVVLYQNIPIVSDPGESHGDLQVGLFQRRHQKVGSSASRGKDGSAATERPWTHRIPDPN